MMQRKFQYILMGVGLTLLVILGALALLLPPAKADNIVARPASDLSADQAIEVERPTTDIVSSNELEETINTATEVQEVEVEQSAEVVIEEQPTRADLGTAENPVTDVTQIIAQVEALAEIYQANVLGKSGWFYVSTEDYFPSEYHSNTGEINGVPVTELYPDDIVLTHSWYLIDNSGQSSEEVGYMVGQEGIIYNRAVTTAGKVVMLDLVGSDPNAIQNAPPRPNTMAYVEDVVGILEGVQSDSLASIMAWQKGGFYTLVLDVMFAEPIIFDNIGDTLFLKSQSTYTFDLNSGAIHQIKYDLEDINGASVTVEQITYLERGYVDQLPQHAVQIMNEATNVVEKADQ